MPSYNSLHIERNLTNYSQRYNNPALINEALFPQVMVQYEADKYVVYDLAHFRLYETLRADRSRAGEVQWKFSEDSYFAQEHSLKGLVTDRERRNADQPLTLDIDTLELVQDGVMLRKEYDAAQLARDPSNYPESNTEALSGTSQWSDYSNSDPLADIKQMQLAVFQASRMYPNTIILPYQVALTLAYHPKILELVKYTHDNLLQSLMGADGMLPKQLFGMQVVIGGAAVTTAQGEDVSLTDLTDVWGKDVIAAYVEQAPKLKSVSYGKTFRTEKYVRKWREEELHGDWVEFNDVYDLKITAAPTGFLLQNVIA
jgi:hypothetical protein